MKLFLAAGLLLCVGVGIGESTKVKGKCPPQKGSGIGICVFNPEINCTGDEACESKGQLCCPDGCNRSCQDPEEREDPQLNCPLTGINPAEFAGICTFDPKVNCNENTDCSAGEVCCPQGCNKICKQPLSLPPRKPTPRPPTPPSGGDDASCPPPGPVTFGACVFDPSVNCVDSSGCLNGKVCCADGCGKVCKDPVGPKKPPQGVCPVSLSGDGAIVGACVYDPSRNCGDHGDCKNGKLCCSVGCGKECINPEPEVVHPATKP